MSGFPIKPPTINSSIYNPSFYTTNGNYLTTGTADQRYLKLDDSRLTNIGLLDGITAGVATPSKLLSLDSLSLLSGTMRLQIDNTSSQLLTDPASNYPMVLRRITTTTGHRNMLGFVCSTTSNSATSPAVAIGAVRNAVGNGCSDFSIGIRATGVAADPQVERLFIDYTGNTLLGGGDMGTTGCRLGIQNTAQSSGTTADYIRFGPHRDTTGLYGSFKIGTFNQTTNADTVNYMYLRPLNILGSTNAGGGMIMTANGRFAFTKGPGTSIITNPAATVEISGSIAYSYSTGYKVTTTGGSAMGTSYPANVSLQLSHSITCGEPVFIVSDERLKTDIEAIPLVESRKLLLVEPVSYRWKNRSDEHREVGVIAQRVQQAGLEHLTSILPSRDPLIEDGKQNTVMYDRIPIHLLNLVKELYCRIAALEERLG